MLFHPNRAPAARRHAAVAHVSAPTLRAIERALGPGTAAEHRNLARARLRTLLAEAAWRVVEVRERRP
jgi:hypothetical protein